MRTPSGRGARRAVSVHVILLVLVIPYASVFGFWAIHSFQRAATQAVQSEASGFQSAPGGLLNYLRVLQDPLIPRMLKNSVVVTGGSLILLFLSSSLAGFAISKLNFRGKNQIFVLLLTGLMLVPAVILTPTFQLLKFTRLLNTYFALIGPYVALEIPIGTLIMKNFTDEIPGELLEAARIDGARSILVWYRIIVPLSVPAFIVVGLLGFLAFWNDYLLAISFMTKSAMVMATMAPSRFMIRYGGDTSLILAASMVISLPALVIFIVLQRYLVSGMIAGAIKA
ncbi:MAG TPA: carbohydrate ABC transporter permease [Spirochaetia bacterium]|nr:carbohydrate ABC transporter permease [Spirochaetia bacterium]